MTRRFDIEPAPSPTPTLAQTPAPTLALTLAFTLALTLASLAHAQQSLADLLPAETILAFGTTDLIGHAEKLDPFIAEFERLDVMNALQQAFPTSADDTGMDIAVPAPLEGLDVFDLLGTEAWIALSASQFNPLPSVSLLARPSPSASAAFAELIADAADDEGVQALTEGNATFYLAPIENADGSLDGSPITALAYAQSGDVLMLSSNPDTLRSLLRQLAGGGEPSFAETDGYAATLAKLGDANLYGYLDLPQVTRVLEPFSQGLGFDMLIERVIRALDTAGVSAGVARFTDTGIESESLQALNQNGGDLALYNLLANPAPTTRDALALMPQGALSISASRTDLTGWWNYLNDLIGSVPELGIGSLDELFLGFVGLDVRATLLDWTGTQVGSITTGVGEVVEPGVPSANLLGEQVFVLEATDTAAAQQGLATLFSTLGAAVSGFADPTGGAGSATSTSRQVEGVDVTSFAVTDGISLSYAVVDGFALIATSDDAMDAVIGARSQGVALPPMVTALEGRIPADATSFSLSDSRATLQSTAAQLSSQLELTAGLGGASGLDFDAVAAATDTLEAFLDFIAQRLGGSVSYGQKRDTSLYRTSVAEVAW